MMGILFFLVAILLAGGLVLIFARDWVWSIDKHSATEHTPDGEPIRTATWDRNHRLQGIVMVVVAVVLGVLLIVLR